MTPDTDSVFHLAAVVSGQAEADFDLGMRVNLDATRVLLEHCRTLKAPPKFVFTSSLAVFGGPLPDPVPDGAPLTPQASYGAQKAIGEYLVYDMSRKGFIDGRSLRLPTVTVRPGKPNKAASSFASGIIREPLAGVDAVCPVAPETSMWVQSPRAVIDNLIVGPRSGGQLVPSHALGERPRHQRGRRRHGRRIAPGGRRHCRRPREVGVRSSDRPYRVDVAGTIRARAGAPTRHARGQRLRLHRPRLHGRRHVSAIRRPIQAMHSPDTTPKTRVPDPERTPATPVRAMQPAAPAPLALASAVARNIVPVAGILFFGWSAANVLVLYFVDTLLAMAVMFAGLMRHFLPPPSEDEGWAARANAEAGYVGAALFIVAFMAVPLGIPLIFMFSGTTTTVRGLFADPAFRTGLVLQAIAAFWSCQALYLALRTHTPDELHLKRRFALVFLRWVAVLLTLYFGLSFLLGGYAPLFFVAVYAAVSIVIDVAPERFLQVMPVGIDLRETQGVTRGATSGGGRRPPGRRNKRRR